MGVHKPFLLIWPFLSFLFLSGTSMAGNDTSNLMKGLYVNVGSGAVSRLVKLPGGFSPSVNINLKNGFMISPEWMYLWSYAPGYQKINGQFWGKTAPRIESTITTVYIGTSNYPNQNSDSHLYCGIGASYVVHAVPENVQLHNPSQWALFSDPYYTYDVSKSYNWGGTIKVGYAAMSKYGVGFGVSGFYSYNNAFQTGGININLVIGGRFNL